jgi:hypothetical protein
LPWLGLDCLSWEGAASRLSKENEDNEQDLDNEED